MERSLGRQFLSHQALAGLSLPFNIGGMLGGWVNFCWFPLQFTNWQERAVNALARITLISNLTTAWSCLKSVIPHSCSVFQKTRKQENIRKRRRWIEAHYTRAVFWHTAMTWEVNPSTPWLQIRVVLRTIRNKALESGSEVQWSAMHRLFLHAGVFKVQYELIWCNMCVRLKIRSNGTTCHSSQTCFTNRILSWSLTGHTFSTSLTTFLWLGGQCWRSAASVGDLSDEWCLVLVASLRLLYFLPEGPPISIGSEDTADSQIAIPGEKGKPW